MVKLRRWLVIVIVLGGTVGVVVQALPFWRHYETRERCREEMSLVTEVMIRVGDSGRQWTSCRDRYGPWNEVECGFGCRDVNDAKLRHLDELKTLTLTEIRGVNFSQNRITDAGLVHVNGLTSLVFLQLADTDITDRGLDKLSGLVNLEVLDVAGTKVTQDGAKYLEKLPKLKRVYAWGTTLTTIRGVEVNLSEPVWDPKVEGKLTFSSNSFMDHRLRPDLLRGEITSRSRAAAAANP